MTTETKLTEVDYFLRLAERGRQPGASGAERRCYLLALAIYGNATALDDNAIIGLADTLRLALAGDHYVQDRLNEIKYPTEG